MATSTAPAAPAQFTINEVIDNIIERFVDYLNTRPDVPYDWLITFALDHDPDNELLRDIIIWEMTNPRYDNGFAEVGHPRRWGGSNSANFMDRVQIDVRLYPAQLLAGAIETNIVRPYLRQVLLTPQGEPVVNILKGMFITLRKYTRKLLEAERDHFVTDLQTDLQTDPHEIHRRVVAV
jgi:hypothetical protein